MNNISKHLFCFGYGYSASYLGDALLKQGWRVSGTCRTQEKCDSLKYQGITTQIFDKDLPLMFLDELMQATHVLISIPPDVELGDLVLQYHLEDLKKSKNLEWIGYLSTTGVYGDTKGSRVDETSAPNPNNDRSVRRVVAENLYLNSGLPVTVFRLAGIYGPGRNQIEELRANKARVVIKPGHVFCRIHVEDIAQILQQAILHNSKNSIYNCSDDMPDEPYNVMQYAAKLTGIALPPDTKIEDLSEMAQSFWQSSRVVVNDKIKSELGVELKYPSYVEGLKGCL